MSVLNSISIPALTSWPKGMLTAGSSLTSTMTTTAKSKVTAVETQLIDPTLGVSGYAAQFSNYFVRMINPAIPRLDTSQPSPLAQVAINTSKAAAAAGSGIMSGFKWGTIAVVVIVGVFIWNEFKGAMGK